MSTGLMGLELEMIELIVSLQPSYFINTKYLALFFVLSFPPLHCLSQI